MSAENTAETTETSTDTQYKGQVYLVDGSGFIFRAYHSLPPLTNPEGTPVGAVYGFTNMLLKLIEDIEADHDTDYIAVLFDTKRKTFRNDIYEAYKANRPEPPEDLVPQFPLVREATKALGLPSVEVEGFEADDLIATYADEAKKQGLEVVIVSSDKDLMQLIEEGVGMFDAMKNRKIGEEEVIKKFGVGPGKLLDAMGLIGDTSDNIPGVPGIGPKTAAELIKEYGSLEALLEKAEEIKQKKRRENLLEFADQARMSKELVALRHDVPVPVTLDELQYRPPDPEAMIRFLKEQGFKSLVTRMKQRFDIQGEDESANPKNLSPKQQTREYTLVQDELALKAWVEQARAAGRVAVDTETTSLNAMEAELVGVSLCVEEGRACYVPLGHVEEEAQGDLLGEGAKRAPEQIPLDRALTILKPLLEDPAVLKIGQNIKYDMLVLRKYEVDITPVDDTMCLSYVLEAGLHGHGMDELAVLHLGVKPISFSEVTGSGKKKKSFAEVDLEAALAYAAEDADITRKLWGELKPRLLSEQMVSVYETLERPLIPVLVAMEEKGVLVNVETLRQMSQEFQKRIAKLEEVIYRLAGHEFTIGSPKQLGEVLFDEMGFEGGKKGKSGAYATGAQILEELAAQGHELPQKVLEWRQLTKLKSTYTDALVGKINTRTGRVHTSYAMTIATTGRLSSTDPNLQNIPIRTDEGRKIRHAFVAKDGCQLISADYSQVELRLLAEVADIAPLKEAFRHGKDIHAITASQMFGLPESEVDSDLRRKAKTINFGIIYGISAHGLATRLGIGRGEAKEYIERYFEQYPGIRKYMDRTIETAREQGYVTTLFGRKIHTPMINEKNPNRRGFAERAAINAPLQGTAADIIKRAMIRIHKALAESDLQADMLLQVHDELILEVAEKDVEKTRALVTELMEKAASLSVPLTVEASAGSNWGDIH